MKKILLIIAAIFLMASCAWAAGTCTQTPYYYQPNGAVTVTLVCTADATGAIDTQVIESGTMNILKGYYYLYQVVTFPGATAPDAADVTVKMNGIDLLGAKGVNLIHATATQDTLPYSTFMSAYRYPLITDNLTVTVANQATNAAKYTIKLIFAK
jgi:hypothetical protein